MPHYKIAWYMDYFSDAEGENGALEAAKFSLSCQRDPDSIATVFIIECEGEEWTIDIEDPDDPAFMPLEKR